MISAVMSCFLIPAGHTYTVSSDPWFKLLAPVAAAEMPYSDSGWGTALLVGSMCWIPLSISGAA
jgi:hypothetical protein